MSAKVKNRGHAPCQYPLGPAVWVTDSRGTQWRLCPELDTPPPTPMPTSRNTVPMPVPHAGAMVVAPGGLRPDQSTAMACTWHTAYGNVPPGTYIAHATWNSTSGTATLTIIPPIP